MYFLNLFVKRLRSWGQVSTSDMVLSILGGVGRRLLLFLFFESYVLGAVFVVFVVFVGVELSRVEI